MKTFEQQKKYAGACQRGIIKNKNTTPFLGREKNSRDLQT